MSMLTDHSTIMLYINTFLILYIMFMIHNINKNNNKENFVGQGTKKSCTIS